MHHKAQLKDHFKRHLRNHKTQRGHPIAGIEQTIGLSYDSRVLKKTPPHETIGNLSTDIFGTTATSLREPGVEVAVAANK